ncbi:MAG: hypothetical protein KatS3mg059_0327 [Thermomicrobiales bacterium]|nr:MAG: hypothetical protein KatS3mg059_0327 [Thermomicrobiales bacterium]
MATALRTATGWEAVVTALRAEGIPYVFGLPGDPSHLYDALARAEPDGGPRAIGVRFETSGAFMAMAYARVTGRPAACFGCPGPGIANLVPGILEAYSGCTPMIVLGVRASRQTYGMGHSRNAIMLACSGRSRSGRRRSRRRSVSLGRCAARCSSPPPASPARSMLSSRPTSASARRKSPPMNRRRAAFAPRLIQRPLRRLPICSPRPSAR